MATTDHAQAPAGSARAAEPFSAVDRRIHLACAWAGPLLIVLFIAGFVIAGFIPPPSPQDGPEKIGRFFDGDTTAIRFGLWMNLFAAALCLPWAFSIYVQMRRMRGDRATPLAIMQLVLGGIFVIEFLVPVMLWQAAAYRPLVNPELTLRLNDLAWLMFIGVVSTGVLQAIVIAVAILRDTEESVYPRWLAFVNLWCALIFMPAGFCVFFKTGPFAWNGIISWWLLVVAFGVWVLSMSVASMRAVRTMVAR